MNLPALLLGIGCLLSAFQNGLAAPEVEFPTIHLRTRQIDTKEEFMRHQRRLLGEAALPAPPTPRHHTASPAWGALRGAHQWLLTHRPDLSQPQQAAVVAHIEAAGCHVAHYLPHHTLVVVGPAEAADAVQQHEHVLWLGLHEQRDKLAPEWRGLLQQLEQLAPQLERLAALGRSAGANATQAAAEAAAALRDSLPAASEWNAAAGQLLVGAVVAFPGLAGPTPKRAAAGPVEHQQRSRRVALERERRDAGAAAAADWAPPLLQRFGARVRRGSADAAIVLAPAQRLAEVLDWLAQRPATHWVAPAPKMRLNNIRASTISQSAQPSSSGSSGIDAAYHPIWAAGITGQGQVVGCGDSGIDRFHCFLSDPAFDGSDQWQASVTLQDGIRTFDSTQHRKIRYHRAYGDTEDSNGHGTHVVGTLVGMPYGTTLAEEAAEGYIGMAPDAKVAFIDLADSSSDKIFTPSDLIGGYFGFTSAVGAWVHSDSWGTNDIRYDYLAQQVDQYSWENPAFLPVLPAGNEGQMATVGMRDSGELTVTSPANAKNCLSVGATQTAGESMETGAVKYSVWDATVTEGEYTSGFRVMQAHFGGSVSGLTGGGQYPLVVASPLDACSPLQNSEGSGLAGAVVLIQRGDCYFSEKALAAQDAGAAAALVFDNVLGAYFVARDDSGTPTSIPVMAITRRIGQQLADAVGAGKALTISFAQSTAPAHSFENLASYSSQGPTLDYRVKPDIVAPGTITSALVGDGSAQDCGVTTMAGTSMATPVTAGSALLLRQYFADGFYPSGRKNPGDSVSPSGALLKAVLLGGAATIGGFEADTGLPVDPPPSFRQGFGRVFLGNSVYLADTPGSRPLQVVDGVPINQGETHSYCIRANGGPLSITLVWTDYPASPMAEKALVHDLDLTVRAAGLNGIPLLGNGGSVADPNTPDRENNVEQVALSSMPPGLVSVTVSGFTIVDAAGTPQYALVVNGDFNGTLTKPGTGNDNPQCTILVAAISAGPNGITSQNPVEFDFGVQGGSSAGINFECRLADSTGNLTSPTNHDWRDCVSPTLYASLPDGAYQFAVRAKGEDIATTQNFVLDTTAPMVSFAADSLQSGAATPEPTANLTFDGSDATGVSFTCTLSASGTVPLQPEVYSGTTKMNMQQVTLGQAYNCTSPQVLHWLLPGTWAFSVVGADPAGNTAPAQQVEWTVEYAEAAGMYTRFLSGPFGLQPKENMTFTFTDLDSAGQAAQVFSAHQCWLEAVGGASAAAYVDCTSPVALPADTKDGSYHFHARVAGANGAAGTEALSTFEVDSVPPEVSIAEPPGAPSSPMLRSNATSVAFNSSEEGVSFYCGLSRSDPGAPAPAAPDASAYYWCTSPAALTNLTDGNYMFAVYAVDGVGNQGKPATSTFLVDITPPAFSDINVPTATAQPEITVAFTATDSGSGINNVTCRFRSLSLADGSPAAVADQGDDSEEESDWQLCTSPQKYSGLQEGRYGVTLRASDKAGLAFQTEEIEVFVDFTPPTVSTDGLPPLGEPVASSVTFHLAELTSDPADSYSNISLYQTLVETVPDEATFGNLQLAIQGGDAPTTGGSSVTKTLNGTGALGRRRLLVESGSGGADATTVPSSAVGSWANCTAECTYEGLSTGLYSIRVRAVDAAGNVGNATEKYPFEVDSSIGSTPFPTWAIIACAAGGALALGTLAYFLWRCCCAAPRRTSGAPPQGAMHSPAASSTYTYSPGSRAYTPYSQGYSPGNGGSGAWGYGAQQPPYAANGYYANGHANGHGVNGHPPGSAEALGITPHTDPIEAQQLALAAAASQREAARRQPSRTPSRAPSQHHHLPPGAAAPRPLDEERQVRLAIDASLQEQQARTRREAEDADLRAAIEASLREQHSRRQSGQDGWAKFSS